MKSITKYRSDQSGSAALVALMVLCLLTIMGLSGARTASVELEIAGNDALNKRAFYSAEASRAYVMMHPGLYGATNVDPSPAPPHLFPNDTDPYVPNTAGPAVPFDLGNDQSFDGSVEYTSSTLPPRNSGNDVTSGLRAHRYAMTCTGSGPRNTTKDIRAGFYRIGL
jgi:hypothetical protein